MLNYHRLIDYRNKYYIKYPGEGEEKYFACIPSMFPENYMINNNNINKIIGDIDAVSESIHEICMQEQAKEVSTKRNPNCDNVKNKPNVFTRI